MPDAHIVDMRVAGEAFCAMCPDHEGCLQGMPCSLVLSTRFEEIRKMGAKISSLLASEMNSIEKRLDEMS